MEITANILTCICLSAATGFRFFLPFFILSAMSASGILSVPINSEWMCSSFFLFLFAFLSAIEIMGYFSPSIDNMLDLIFTGISIFSGLVIFASFSSIGNPVLKWGMSLIIGGGISLNVQLLTVKMRTSSFIFKSGIGNPFVSVIELLSSLIISIFALLFPFLSVFILFILIFLIYKLIIEKGIKETSLKTAGN